MKVAGKMIFLLHRWDISVPRTLIIHNHHANGLLQTFSTPENHSLLFNYLSFHIIVALYFGCVKSATGEAK